MSDSITVFTYGDPTHDKSERIGSYLQWDSRILGARILGRNSGHGDWNGEEEHCGSLIVSGLTLDEAFTIARWAADLHEQDAVGVIHNATGRTLAAPGAPKLLTAEEVWA